MMAAKERLSRTRDEIVAEAKERGILLPGVGRTIEEMQDLRAQTPCNRCGGGGHYSFNMLDGTMCYGCRGSGKGPIISLDAYVKNTQARDRRENKAKRAIVEAAAAADERMARLPSSLNRAAQALGFAGAEQLWADKVGEHEHLMTREVSFVSQMVDRVRGGRELSEKQAAYVESIPQNLQDREDKKAKQRDAGFLGKPGEKFEVEARLFFSRTMENNWGDSTMAKFETDEGHILTWWATGTPESLIRSKAIDYGDERVGRYDPSHEEVSRKGRVTLKGSIKKHEVYQGSPQTVVTRCKLTWINEED